MVLVSRFTNIEGLERIVQRQYTIQDPRTKEVYQFCQPFTECFRPGRRIVMSALFSSMDPDSQTCPGCGSKSPGFADEEVLW